MPRVPQVFASPDIGGSTTPVRAPLSFGDTSEAQRGVEQIAKSLRVFTQAKDTLSDEQDKIAAELAMGEFEKAHAEADIRMRQDPTLTPDNYSERVDENLRMAREGVSKVLSPRARLLFDRAAEKYTTKESIKGKYEGLALSDAFVKAGTDTLLEGDATEGIVGEATLEEQARGITSEQKRDAAVQRGFGRIENLLTRKILTGTEANERITKLVTKVQTGRVQLDLDDPQFRQDTLDRLTAGKVSGLPYETQRTIASTAMKEDAANKKRAEDAAEKQAKQDKDDFLSDIYARAASGAETPAQVLRALNDGRKPYRVSGPEYHAALDFINKPPSEREAASDQATLDAVTADVHSVRPKMTEAQLLNLREQGLLNYKDWKSSLDTRRSTIEGLRREGHSLVMERHHEAQREVDQWLGIETPFSVLDKAQSKLRPAILMELRRRSNAFPGGKEDPMAISAELVPRIQKYLGDEYRFTAQEIEKQLTYKSMDALETAHRNKSVPDGFYETEKKRLLEWRQMQEKNMMLQEQIKQAPPPPKKGFFNFGGGSSSSGTTNQFQRAK